MSSSAERDLEMTNANVGLWLVKVPKYISEKWERAPANTEVAKLQLRRRKPGQKSEATLNLSDTVLALKQPGEEDIPKHYKLDTTTITNQTLGVFSYTEPSVKSGKVVPKSGNLCMVGKVMQKLECRPRADNTYMNLKLASIKKASEPHRKVQQLSRAVQNFKPVSNHKNNIEYEEKKKAEGKKMRDDKDVVLNMLFAAFEKHQYYTIKDLVTVTRQPVVYLKEILNEVCIYNVKSPHRNMWELKPEYRHYSEDKPAET